MYILFYKYIHEDTMENKLPLYKQVKPINRTKLLRTIHTFIYLNNIQYIKELYETKNEIPINKLLVDIISIFIK